MAVTPSARELSEITIRTDIPAGFPPWLKTAQWSILASPWQPHDRYWVSVLHRHSQTGKSRSCHPAWSSSKRCPGDLRNALEAYRLCDRTSKGLLVS